MKLAAALVIVIASAAGLTGTADAQPAAPESLAAQDCARFRKQGQRCVLSFDREEVEGGVPTGAGLDVWTRGIARFGSLIRLREDFRAEIIRAAEDL